MILTLFQGSKYELVQHTESTLISGKRRWACTKGDVSTLKVMDSSTVIITLYYFWAIILLFSRVNVIAGLLLCYWIRPDLNLRLSFEKWY